MPKKIKSRINRLFCLKLLLTIAVTITTIGIRHLGGLQWLEWLAVDLLFKLQPSEGMDRRIVLVGETEEDIQAFKSAQISDRTMAQLLTRIEQQEPIAVGVDFFRDQPVGEGREQLLELFETNPNFYGVGKQTGDRENPLFAPVAPPPINQSQITEVAVQPDSDGVLRRMFLFPQTKPPALPNLGLVLAYEYLAKQGIYPEPAEQGWLQLNQATFWPFRNSSGPYTQIDDGSYQIFLNWRNVEFEFVSISDVLSGHIKPSIFKDKLVIIGSYASSKKDYFFTPFSRTLSSSPELMFGMEVQAQLASVIISNALGERPLIKFWEELEINIGLVVFGIIICFCLNEFFLQWKLLTVFLLTTSTIIAILSYSLFILGIWIPIIPTLILLWSLGIIMAIFDYEWQQKRQKDKILALNERLKKKIDERQIYRDYAVLLTPFEESLTETLQYISNSKYLISTEEEILTEKINQFVSNPKHKIKIDQSVSQLTIYYQQIMEKIEYISQKTAIYFPTLDSLASLTYKESNLPQGLVEIQSLIDEIISSIRRVIYNEYGVDLLDLITLKVTPASTFIRETHKLLIIFNRIFDDIFLSHQIEEKEYPLMKFWF
ncbi:CHASE2 domain-containing protein [Crocosphaera chwakensis]|uniref:Adenylate cyclase n=1 Tax=Crocosphaera chwakensis CCY0110 TaxID=391612 RepID=A3IZI6_9CHRO|nr:CHASE2 domain-containing protein [Crocosphaera chwakensis]EAZ88106.1 adenylate cyclase [Crocosphaera chwakensis CCY0110]